jgi:lipopolysaccharide transport system permease protein
VLTDRPKGLRGILRYRELIYFMVRSEIALRYKQTILGPAWALLEPIVSMIVFTAVFRRFESSEFPSISVPYPVFLYAGLLPWVFFRSTVANGARSLVRNRDIIERVYFPREILVGVDVLLGVIDFVMSFGVLLMLMLIYEVPIRIEILLVFPLLVGLALLVTGLALCFSILNARFRDVRQVLPYALQILMYLSPVIYPPSFLTGSSRWLLTLNPLTGYLDAFRSVIIGAPERWDSLAISFGMSIIVFVLSWMFFKRYQALVVDVL